MLPATAVAPENRRCNPAGASAVRLAVIIPRQENHWNGSLRPRSCLASRFRRKRKCLDDVANYLAVSEGHFLVATVRRHKEAMDAPAVGHGLLRLKKVWCKDRNASQFAGAARIEKRRRRINIPAGEGRRHRLNSFRTRSARHFQRATESRSRGAGTPAAVDFQHIERIARRFRISEGAVERLKGVAMKIVFDRVATLNALAVALRNYGILGGKDALAVYSVIERLA